MKKILITGGCGFVGSALIRWLLAHTEARITNLDALTYAAQPAALADHDGSDRYRFVQGDLTDAPLLGRLLAETQPEALIHLAAETHVDRSIDGPAAFMHSNLQGTFTLLEATRQWLASQSRAARAGFRLLQVSTDEVYGDRGEHGAPAHEEAPWRTSSPYAASKAGADHLADAWYRTWGLPVMVSHSSNNYGPWQYPEKLIPVVIRQALAGQPIPLYGDGQQVRDWLHVDDHARALWCLLQQGEPGQHYNISAQAPLANADLVQRLCALLDQASPQTAPPGGHASLILPVADRPGHDRRYAITSDRIQALGWQPHVPLQQGLKDTVAFYLAYFRGVPSHARS
ncbi:dTDP-glucose 4,6-dehydratase [Isoalcanivorax indicus]|uniref:dTDP-glucose 4,6-dehydratase n=1 Tax=Isoalcanivorax indicus TaxID=2202653 RepID=UPI000DBAB7A5|nr:dTDP-glucose 4,6-dehydratase [Isoalcanivorax indicus]